MPKSLSASILIVTLFFVTNCSAQNNNFSYLKARYDNAIECNSQDSAYYLATQMKEWAFRNESDTSVRFAMSLRFLGDYFSYYQVQDSAEYYFVKAINILKNKKEGDQLELATSMNNLGRLYSYLGNYKLAETNYIQSLEIRRDMLGVWHVDYASSILSIGIFYYQNGDFKQAEMQFKLALEIFTNLNIGDNAEFATNLNCLGMLYDDLGNYDLAQSYYKKALEMRRKVLGENHPGYAGILNNLGVLLHKMGKFNEAEKCYIESMRLKGKVEGENSLDYAMNLNNLGNLYSDMGEYKLAEEFYKKSLVITKKCGGEHSSSYANNLFSLGTLYIEIANYQQAEFYLMKSLEIIEIVKSKSHPDYAACINNLGCLKIREGEYLEAESFFKIALELREKSIGVQHLDYADCLNNLGNVHYSIGNYEGAKDYYLMSSAIIKSLMLENSIPFASSLSQIALCQIAIGEFDKAESALCEAISIFESVEGGVNQTNYATTLFYLGNLYLDSGSLEVSEYYFRRSLEVESIIFGDLHPDCAALYNSLGNLYELKEDYLSAELFINKAFTIYKETLEDTNPSYIMCEYNLARIYAKNGQPNLAFNILKSNYERESKRISENFEWLSEKQKNDYWNLEEDYFIYISQFSNDVFNTIPDAAGLNYNSTLYSKGRLLEAKLSSENYYNDIDEMREELAYRRRLLAKMESDGSTESIRMNKLRKEADSLDKKLTLSWPEYAQQKKNLTITWQQVQQNLEKGEAAIEFVRFYNEDDSLYYYNALVVKKGDSNPTLVRLCMEKELETITPKNGCLEYFPLIWQPLEGALEGITTVYYSPVGLLNNIAFSAISISGSAEGENRYLLDRYNLHQLISTRYLAMGLKQKQFVKTEVSIALFGGLDYDFLPGIKNKKSGLSGRQNNMRGGEVSSYKVPFLQGTKDEVDQIASTFKSHVGNVQKFEGVNGTEEAFMQLENKASFTVLHVATHGFALPVFDFKDSTISKNSLRYSYRYSTNPMVRSGLIMSGGYWAWNGSDTLIKLGASQNGILTALEISQLNLRKTKLVVLSACETGLGKIDNSEGTFGLKRSFKLAGVEQLIVSLWSVPDKETKELMKLFYSDFAISLNPAESFNKAQKQMRNKYPDEPEKWAAFVLIR